MKLIKIEEFETENGRFILLGDKKTNGKVYCEGYFIPKRLV